MLCFIITFTLLFKLQSGERKVCWCNSDGLVIAHKLALLEQMPETAGRPKPSRGPQLSAGPTSVVCQMPSTVNSKMMHHYQRVTLVTDELLRFPV